MKLSINIEHISGESATYVALPPEFMKWEIKTGNTIQQIQDKLGIGDLLFLAYNAMKRELAGKPVKPFEIWCETVSDVSVGEMDSPKAIQSEV